MREERASHLTVWPSEDVAEVASVVAAAAVAASVALAQLSLVCGSTLEPIDSIGTDASALATGATGALLLLCR